jgi:hypothetical protein
LKIGQDVNELDLVLLKDFLHPFRVHAVVVQGYSDELWLVHSPRLNGPQIGGHVGEDLVVVVDEQPANEVQRLLRSVGHENVAGHSRDAILLHGLGQELFERRIAFRGTILQRLGATVLQGIVARFPELPDGEQFGRGQPTSKGDHIWLHGPLEQLANDRAPHPR